MGINEDWRNKQYIKNIADGMVRSSGSYIFVIGAGASVAAGIPTSSQLRNILIQSWEKEIETKLKASELKIRYDDPKKVPLEILLPIYAEVVQKEDAIEKFLKGQLDRFSSWQTFSPLCYEILAHLTNNGLVRHIICLNFDELLDVALDEELGENNYEKVRSKSTFTRLKEDIEESRDSGVNILEGKILFKPHGTLSLSATLRPTLDEVLNLEEDKYKVLWHVLTDNNVIFIGYSFMDPDIQKVFLPLADGRRLKEIYFVDNNKNLLKDNEKIKALLSKGVQPSAFIPMDSDKFFQELASAITKNDQGKFYPTTTRHQIRNYIFSSEKLSCRPSLENRLLVELIIFALKVKGKFSTKALLTCERVKYYTTKLFEVREKSVGKLPTPYELLERFKDYGILKIETVKGQKVYGIGEETCYLVGKNKDTTIKGIIRVLPQLLGKDCDWQKGVKKNFQDQMVGLVKDFDYDLSFALHPFEFSFSRLDHKKNPIKFRQTLVAVEILQAAAKQKEPCFVIAETGEWLLSDRVSVSNDLKNIIRIIVSDYRNDPIDSLHRAISENIYIQLKNKFGQNKIGLLDWHLNKHHGTFSGARCIYFYKEGKSPTLQPLELSHHSDTERMMELCEYLWQQCNFLRTRGRKPKK